MSSFKRRPFMAGHTDVFVMAQPYITGTEHINSSGLLDTVENLATAPVTQFELTFETEAGVGDFTLDVSTTTEADRTLAAIVEALNSSFGSDSSSPLIEATDFEGCLRIQTLGSGLVDTDSDAIPDTLSFVRILPNTSGSTSYANGADLFGFPIDPHPNATAMAGDLAHAPGRPLTQVNRPGVAFLARGEDRVSQNFNRALHQLAINEDSLNTRLSERVPVPTVVDFESTDSRLIVDGTTGQILGVNLISSITPTTRVYVGGLDRESSLVEIAEYFSVQDQDDNQIQADERVVRIGAVINGYNPASSTVPTFPSEWDGPTSPLADALDIASPDYGNLLGVQVVKSAATTIDEVRDGTVLICEGATFETDGVIAGDIAVISGSSINAPVNHNGEYYVETVISETRLEVRPTDPANVLILNESASGGLGDVSIKTDGAFAQNAVLLFSPPIADFPPDRVADDGTAIPGILRVVLGVEAPLGEVPATFLTRSTVKTAAEVDAFVTRRLWRRMSFDGLYQGQSYDYRGSQQGGGAEGRVTHGPITFNLLSDRDRPAAFTSEMVGTGSLEMRGTDLVLTSDNTFVFSDTDIGKVVFVSDTSGGTPLFADETPFTLSEFLSYREIRLTPPVDYKDWRLTDLSGTVTCDFTVVSEGQAAAQAALMIVANDLTPGGDTAAKTGYVFVRNHRDASDDAASPGTSLLHLDKIRKINTYDGVSVVEEDARLVAVSTSGTSCAATVGGVPVIPAYNMHMFWGSLSGTAGPGASRESNGVGVTLLRIVNGPNAGFYEISVATAESDGSFSVQPIENSTDGSTSWAGFISTSVQQYANLYNVVSSVGAKRADVTSDVDGPTTTVVSGVSAFADSYDKGAGEARAIQSHWIGPGSALYVRVNEGDFYGHSLSNPSSGYAIDVRVFNPAEGGHIRAHANFGHSSPQFRHASALKLFSDSNVLYSDGTDGDEGPEGVALQIAGATLTAVGQNFDPAGYFVSGLEENGEEGRPNVGDSPQSATSTVVVVNAKDLESRGGSWDTVVTGLYTGALAYSGSVFGSTNSPLVAFSTLSSSVGVLPTYGGTHVTWISELQFGDFTVASSDNWTYGKSDQKVWLDLGFSAAPIDALGYGFGGWDGYQTTFLNTQSNGLRLRAAETDSSFHLSNFLGYGEVRIGEGRDVDVPAGVYVDGQEVEWTGADYSIFPMTHQMCITIPANHSEYSEKEWASFPGRIAYLTFSLDGDRDNEVSYLYRIEATCVLEDGRHKIALRADADDTRVTDPTLFRKVLAPGTFVGATSADLTAVGVKAARWSLGFVDVADIMAVGTATALNGISPHLAPFIGSTPSVLVSTGAIRSNGNSLEFPRSAAYNYGAGHVATTGAFTGRKTSLNQNLGKKAGRWEEIYNAALPTNSYYWGGSQKVLSAVPPVPFFRGLNSTDSYLVQSSPISEFLLLSEHYERIKGDEPHQQQSLKIFPIAERDETNAAAAFLTGDVFFSKEDLPADIAAVIAANPTLSTDPFFPSACFSEGFGGGIAVTANETDPNTNSIGMVRAWLPLGRNFVATNFSGEVELILSKLFSPTHGTNRNPRVRFDIRRHTGESIYTDSMRLDFNLINEPGGREARTSRTKATFYLDPKNIVDGAHGGVVGQYFNDENDDRSREAPVFLTMDFMIGTADALEEAVDLGIVDDLVSATQETMSGSTSECGVLFSEDKSLFGIATGACLEINLFEVSQVSEDLFVSRGIEAAGTSTARDFKFRDAVKRRITYPGAAAQFITGSIYSGLSSSGDRSYSAASPFFYGTGPTENGQGAGEVVGKIQPWPLIDSNTAADSAPPKWTAGRVDPNDLFPFEDKLEFWNHVVTASIDGQWGQHPKVDTNYILFGSDAPSGVGEEGYIPGDSSWNAFDYDVVFANPWFSPRVPFGAMRHGLAGAQITGGNWSDPLWYQQATLVRNDLDSPQNGGAATEMFMTIEDAGNSTSSVDKPAFFVDPTTRSFPSPTGFFVPLTGVQTGDALTAVSVHLSIRPHFWGQHAIKLPHERFWAAGPGEWQNTAHNPNDSSFGGYFRNMPGTNPRVNRYRQGEWGIYHSMPLSSSGILDNSVEEWENRAGFVLELWQVPLGSDDMSLTRAAQSGDQWEHTGMAHPGTPVLLATKTVNLADHWEQKPYELNYCTDERFSTRYTSDGFLKNDSTVSGNTSESSIHRSGFVSGEYHVKDTLHLSRGFDPDTGSVEVADIGGSYRADTNKYAYVLAVRFHLAGDRAFTATRAWTGQQADSDLSEIDSYWVEGNNSVSGRVGTVIDNESSLPRLGFPAYAEDTNLQMVRPPEGARRHWGEGYWSFIGEHENVQVTLKSAQLQILTDVVR